MSCIYRDGQVLQVADDVMSQIYNALKLYVKETEEQCLEVAEESAKQLAKDLNAASKQFPYRKRSKIAYNKSWTSKKVGDHAVVVYSKVPGIPHVLENGHALIVRGVKKGTVPAHVHIRPVVDEAKENYEKAIREALGG